MTAKYFTIEQDGAYEGHPLYWVINKRSMEEIARIVWYPTWKRRILDPNEDTAWSADCLLEIVAFLNDKNKEIKR